MIKYFTGQEPHSHRRRSSPARVDCLGASLSMGKAEEKTTIGYVNSQRLIEEFLEPAVQEPLAKETDRLQKELDAEIAKLRLLDEEAKLKKRLKP